MKWWLDIPEAATAKFWAVTIQQHEPMSAWRSALARVPEELRPAAEQYLREIAQRGRVAEEAKRDRAD